MIKTNAGHVMVPTSNGMVPEYSYAVSQGYLGSEDQYVRDMAKMPVTFDEEIEELDSNSVKAIVPGTYNNKTCNGVVGFCTSGTRHLYIYIPINLANSVSSISVSSLKAGLRLASGGYIGGAEYFDLTSYISSVSISWNSGIVEIVCYNDSGWGITNNSTFCGRVFLSAVFS